MHPMRFGGFACIFGSVLITLALVLGAGGVWLMALGGVTYYLAAAIGLLLTGLLLAMRSRWALWSHTALLLATLAWALNEVGLDWVAARGTARRVVRDRAGPAVAVADSRARAGDPR